MTHRGIPQTFASALPTLLKLSRNIRRNRMVLCCRGQSRFHEVNERAREIPDLDWSVCPLDLLQSPFAATVQALDAMATARTPLTGWPDRFKPWVVIGMMALQQD